MAEEELPAAPVDAVLDAKVEIAAAKEYPAGKEHVLQSVALPIDTKETVLHVSRDGLPDLGAGVDVLEVRQEFSFDGGLTWEFGGAATFVGGVHVHRDGHVMSTCQLGISGVPGEKNPNRMIRPAIIAAVPITVKVELEARSKETIPSQIDPGKTEADSSPVHRELLADKADPDNPSFDPAYLLELWNKYQDVDSTGEILNLLKSHGLIIKGINA